MMQIVTEKLAVVQSLGSQYDLKTQVLGLIGAEMFLIFLLWIIPPPITAPFDIGSFIAFACMLAIVFKGETPVTKYVKYWIMMHVFILVLYLLVYEVIFNWIITPGKKEQTLSIWKILLILLSCVIDGLLYIKWIAYTEGQDNRETDFPETVLFFFSFLFNFNLLQFKIIGFVQLTNFIVRLFAYLNN